jgi:uncharacterized protein
MVVAARARPTAFHVMAKPTGAVCNLDCEYCYFLSKSALYPGSSFRMSDRVLETYLRQLFQAQRHAAEVVVSFQGGEPTMMGLDFFRRALRLERRYALPRQRVVHTLQTNGTLLDDEWGAFLHEHDFLVGLSIDGPREMHDAYRVDKGGKPTFDRVLRGLDVLRRHHVEWNALTTVHAANGDHGLEVYRFLRDDLGATFVQLIPIVERVTAEVLPLAEAGWGERAGRRPLYRQEGDRVTHRSVGSRQYGQFLADVFDEWVRHDVGRVFVQMFDTALGHWLAYDQTGMCVHAVTCGGAVALEHTGDVYSCDHYVEPDFRLGSLADGDRLVDLVGSARQVAFGGAKAESLPRACRACPFLFACNGGCPKDRFDTTADGDPDLNHLCEGYQLFFAHVAEPMRVMADLVRRGEPPATVMQWCAERDARRTTDGSG